MHLWNDYEGKTLAGTFPIEALLRAEGRNACFATHDRDGRPAVLRLTEALNDQQEMRARFEAIRDMGQRNLVSIEDFGDVEMEGTPLIYLVMEPTQESLEDIIRERRLTVEETGEVAASLSAALEALHAHGLVHGQVEPASVLAAGQVIKLRSDCVRPAPQGANGERARAEDVFGLADVLHRSLTQQRLLDASDALALPEPYASIVRNVVRGSWGIEQVANEVRRHVRSPAVPPGTPPVLADEPLVELDEEPFAAAELDDPVSVGRTTVQSGAASEPQLRLYANAEQAEAPDPRQRTGKGWRTPPETSGRASSPMLWVAGAAGLCLLLVLAWHFADGSNKGRAEVANAAAMPVASSNVPATPNAVTSTPRVVAPASAVHGVPAHSGPLPGSSQVWRVVAYTYNVEKQAQAKAHTIAQQHAELDPQVYSRTGHAPFLVTLGGPLTEQQAAAMRERARSEGLARDVYIQNYSR